MARIELDRVSLDHPLLGVHSRSLKLTVASAVGGRFIQRKSGPNTLRALSNISFTASDGDRIGLQGHNGAGKTTLLRLLAGIYTPSEGRISIEGRVLPMLSISVGIYPDLTGRENIKQRGILLGLTNEAIAEATPHIIAFSGLESYIDLPLRTYSTGMSARLLFSMSTFVPADILLMDEWFGVADQDFRQKAEARLNDFIEKSGILVLASHSSIILENICTKIIVLDHGNIVDVIDRQQETA